MIDRTGATHNAPMASVSGFCLLTNALSQVSIRGDESASGSATILVAAHDAASTSQSSAQFVADGLGDQEEINAAIRSLPKNGGTVLLSEGTFDIRRIPGKLGGILIERSHVVLAGCGTATRLIQAPGQETDVIRIIGRGVGHVTVRDLFIDANSDANPLGDGDTNVSHHDLNSAGSKHIAGSQASPAEKTSTISQSAIAILWMPDALASCWKAPA